MRAQGKKYKKHIILDYKKTRNYHRGSLSTALNSFVDDKPRIGTSIVS